MSEISQTNNLVVEVTEATINDVLQQSMDTPVLLDFWADWCEPCKALAPVLNQLVEQYAGGFILAKVNADEQQMICQQLGVQSLPSLKLVSKGQLVGELTGAQPESEIRALLEKVVAMPEDTGEKAGDDLMQQVERARSLGAFDEAINALMQALEASPDNNTYKAEIVNLLTEQNKLDEAENVLSQIPDDVPEKAGAKALLGFAHQLQQLPTKDEVQQKLSANPKDVSALFAQGVYQVIAKEFDAALDAFLQVMTLDRTFDEDAGRLALLDVFNILGTDDARSKSYRRKMFAQLH